MSKMGKALRILLWTGLVQFILWAIIIGAGVAVARSQSYTTSEIRELGRFCGTLASPLLLMTVGIVGVLVNKGKLPGCRLEKGQSVASTTKKL